MRACVRKLVVQTWVRDGGRCHLLGTGYPATEQRSSSKCPTFSESKLEFKGYFTFPGAEMDNRIWALSKFYE